MENLKAMELATGPRLILEGEAGAVVPDIARAR